MSEALARKDEPEIETAAPTAEPVESPARAAQAKVARSMKAAKADKPAKTNYREFKVDLWATDFNDAEIGIYQRARNEAASDQFTKDMEIIGQVVEDGERTGLLAFRRELWREDKNFDRRLVIKMFSEKLSWRGSLELMMGRSLQLTLGSSGVSVPAYSMNLARHEQIIQLERSANKWPFMPEKFSFFLLTKNGPRFYKLRRNVIAIGADYTLYDQKGRKIGQLDHRIINLGGAWRVKLDKAHSHAQLERAIQLFCTMLKFNGQSRRHVSRMAEAVLRGRLKPAIDHHEEDLYLNPRRRR
ncbi:MAG: hypothetical protein AAGA24_02870 [Pseudomonadota bacterium]